MRDKRITGGRARRMCGTRVRDERAARTCETNVRDDRAARACGARVRDERAGRGCATSVRHGCAGRGCGALVRDHRVWHSRKAALTLLRYPPRGAHPSRTRGLAAGRGVAARHSRRHRDVSGARGSKVLRPGARCGRVSVCKRRGGLCLYECRGLCPVSRIRSRFAGGAPHAPARRFRSRLLDRRACRPSAAAPSPLRAGGQKSPG
jgi:hypothetical protein